MKNKLLILVLMVLMLTGCQLALDEYPMNKGNDQMIGVVVIDGKIDKSLFKNSKLYLDEIDEHHYDFSVLKDNGYIGSSYMYMDTFIEDKNEEKVECLMNTDGLNAGVLEFFAINSSVEKKITNQLYLIHDTKDVRLNLYQLMQDEENQVYVLDHSEDFSIYFVSTEGEGKYGGVSISGKVSNKVNGFELSYEEIVSNIEVHVVYEPVKVEIIEMNSKDEMITSKIYLQNDIPSTYTPGKQTEYLFIKKYVLKDGEEIIEYSVVNKSDNRMNVNIKYNESICLLKSIDIIWE